MSSQNIFGATQESDTEFTGQQLIQKKTFSLNGEVYSLVDEKGSAEATSNKSQDTQAILQEIMAKLNKLDEKLDMVLINQQILSNGQGILATNQGNLAKKVDKIAENLMVKPEMMAQTKALLECKVSIKRVESSVCRMTGESRDSKIEEVAALLPLRSVDGVKEMEEKLEVEDFAQATTIYMHKLKGASEDVNSVIRSLFTDDLLQLYNWDGRLEKHSLAKLSICDKILRVVFQKQPALEFEKSIRKAVERSHNRQKQKKYARKEKN